MRAEGQLRLAMRAEDQLPLVVVVAPAAKRDVGDGGRPLHRVGLDVVELQERALRASPSGGGHEGALASVAPPDRALDLPRHMAGGQAGSADFLIRFRTDRPIWPWPGDRRQLRLLDLLEQYREGAVEDRARIAVGDLAAEKRLQAPQLLVGLLADGELHAITLGSRGLDDRASGGGQRWRRR